MEPAHTIVGRLGGEVAVAKIAGVAVTAPYRWQQPKAKGGTGGVIPHWHVAKLLAHAEANGIDLSATDFAPVVALEAPQPARASL